jgi:2-C-methyl-D-erythritol 4-phosphate cytidylyltransferase
MKVAAIIVAAGEGLRVGGSISKTYLPLCGRPMILRTLDRVFAAKTISSVVVVVAANELARSQSMLRQDPRIGPRPWQLHTGGATRQESVRCGLAALAKDSDFVAIHDGARPFVSPEFIDRCVEAAHEKGAVVPGLPARNTIKLVGADRYVQSTPPRNALWEIQTPQVFRKDLIQAAHERALAEHFEATDDAMLVEHMGEPVYVLEGDKTNFKITLPEDVWLAETLIRAGKVS